MNSEPKVILFDLGRVLMHIDFEAFPNALGLLTKEQRAPFEVPVQKIIFLYELGKITTEEFLDTLFLIFEERFTRGQILEAFDAIIVNDNPEIIPFVQSVREKYSIAVLSNTSPSHWEKVLRVSSVIKLFPNTFTSFQLGAMKPEKIVYQKVCQSLNVQPKEILFIDDLKENIEGAIAVGMHGVIFHSIDSLKYLTKDKN